MKKVWTSAVIISIAALLTIIFFTKGQWQKVSFFNIGKENNEEKQEKVVLHFIHWRDFPKSIFDSFNKEYPNITVEFERYDINQFRDVQRSRILSGENIDIMGVFEKDYKEFINKGDLTDISSKTFINNYEPRAIKAVKDMYNNKLYALPYKSRVCGMWYNKMIFDKFNLKVPTNYEEFLRVCEKLRSNNVPALIQGANDAEISNSIFYLGMWDIQNKDAQWFNNLNTGKAKWTDKEMVEAFNRTDQFVKKGYLVQDSVELTDQQAFSKFINGQVAMYLTDDWSLDMYEAKNWNLCEPGVFSVPYNTVNESNKVPGTEAAVLVGIYSQSEHKSEAELLLDYLSKTEIAQTYSDKMMAHLNIMGVNTYALKYDSLWQPLRQRVFMKPLNNVLDDDILEKLNESAKELIIQNVDIKDVLKELQDIQEEVNKNKN